MPQLLVASRLKLPIVGHLLLCWLYSVRLLATEETALGPPSQGSLFSSSASFIFKSCHSQLQTRGLFISCVTLMSLSVILIQKTPSQAFSYKCCIPVGSGYRTHRLRAVVSVARHRAIKVKALELFLTDCVVLKHGLSRWLCVPVWKAWMSLQRLKSNESLTLHNLS